jgi:hypothetical protein
MRGIARAFVVVAWTLVAAIGAGIAAAQEGTGRGVGVAFW